MNSNAYPFTTRRQILERIETDPSFVSACFAMLQDRHERRSVGRAESMGWIRTESRRAPSRHRRPQYAWPRSQAEQTKNT